MTRFVYKYPFNVTDTQTVTMPSRCRVVMVALQGDGPCLWAEVEAGSAPRRYTLRVFGTGHAIDDDALAHTGSFQQGSFVWHVYLKPEG